MAKLSIVAGTTSKLVDIFIQDSSSTTGGGLATPLAFNSSSLTAYYYREGAASAVKIDSGGATALVTMTLGTWVSCGFVVIDNANMPGCYQLGLPDAAIAAGAKSVVVMLKGANNMAQTLLEIELTATNNQNSVNGGMTALPNAAAEAAGGLYTRGSGPGQIAQQANGQIDANLSTIKTQTVTCAGGVTVPAATLASTTNIASGTITTVTDLTVTTFAEPGQGTPAATTTLAAKINYLYKAWRNKVTQTSSTYSLFADDTTTVDQKATVSDDGTTFTRGEMATGP